MPPDLWIVADAITTSVVVGMIKAIAHEIRTFRA
jgi:hypothetical protein